MLSTFNRSQFDVSVNDTTVSFRPGTARIGDTLMPFNGTRKLFTEMASFDGRANTYQNVLMYIKPVADTLDMTRSVSDTTANPLMLKYPSMVDSTGFPIALFTFFSSDGVTPQLISYMSI